MTTCVLSRTFLCFFQANCLLTTGNCIDKIKQISHGIKRCSWQWAEFWCQLLLRRYKEMIIFPGTVCGVVVFVFFFCCFLVKRCLTWSTKTKM